MISHLLLEAAIRSILLALAVWIGLRAFSVRNVLAQKAAWGLVLASALVMPMMLHVTAHVPGVVIPSAATRWIASLIPQPSSAPQVLIAVPGNSIIVAEPAALEDKPLPTPSVAVPLRFHTESPNIRTTPVLHPDSGAAISPSAATEPPTQPTPATDASKISLLKIAGLIYLAIAAILFARLLYGCFAAIKVWHSAKPVRLHDSVLTRGLHLRASDAVSSPVTIGSAVVLPANYRQWDAAKLRIVLAHERSHVRQGDFYLQLLAGMYAAVVWFSPLGWWLKRKLSDLAEAISDRAGLEEAVDRTSYAQVLLEFAAAPRPTPIGVAMARNGSLSRRIERLLNDASFRQAFAGTRRSVVVVLLIPVALFAASALVRVQASGQEPIAPPVPEVAPATPEVVAPQAPSVTPVAPITGVSTSQPDPFPPAAPELDFAIPEATPQAAARAVAPVAPGAAVAPPAPPAMTIAPLAPPSGSLTLIAPKAPGIAAKVMVLPQISSGIVLRPMVMIAPRAYGAGYGNGAGQSSSTQSGSVEKSESGKRSGYRYSYSSDGDSYAIIRGDNQSLSFNGNIHNFDVDKARKQAHGDFLWFEHDGKSYFVDDPGTVSQIEAMYKPMENLGRQQEILGKKQEALGKQQEELGKQQESASVPAPDMSKEIAKIDEAMAKLKASQGKEMTQDQFGELQERLAELQARLGEIQGRIGERQSDFGVRMDELSEKMGALGAQMGELGSEQGRIAQEADRKVKAIIDQSLKNGKAHPVQ